MRQTGLVVLGLVMAGLLAASAIGTRSATFVPARPAATPAHTTTPHVFKIARWQAPTGLDQIPIWPNGAPDMAGIPVPPERLEIAQSPEAIGGHNLTASSTSPSRR